MKLIARMPGIVRMPPRLASFSFTFRISGPLTVLCMPIDRRQGAVEERVVAVDEGRQAAILAQDALEEQARFIVHRRAQLAGHLREFSRVKGLAGELVQAEPLRTEPIEQGARERGSPIRRRACPASTCGSCSLPASASADNSASGIVAHNRYERREAS